MVKTVSVSFLILRDGNNATCLACTRNTQHIHWIFKKKHLNYGDNLLSHISYGYTYLCTKHGFNSYQRLFQTTLDTDTDMHGLCVHFINTFKPTTKVFGQPKWCWVCRVDSWCQPPNHQSKNAWNKCSTNHNVISLHSQFTHTPAVTLCCTVFGGRGSNELQLLYVLEETVLMHANVPMCEHVHTCTSACMHMYIHTRVLLHF